MSLPLDARAERLRCIIGAVARQTLRDRGCERIALLDDASPEARLAAEWLAQELGPERIAPVRADEHEVESLLQPLRAAPRPGRAARARRVAAEVRRLLARCVEGALVANPANKTALLLGGLLPPDPFFPLGDLYASEVAQLAGGWWGEAEVVALAEACGGVERLDAALRQRVDRRDPRGLESLDVGTAERVEAALAHGRAARVHPMVTPKLGSRTLGVDLFE